MTQRERVIKHLLTMPKNVPVLVEFIQKDLRDIGSGSLSSILTVLHKTGYFKRVIAEKKAAFMRVKTASFQEILNAFRKKDMELYGQFKGKTPPNHRRKVKKAIEPSHQDVVPALKTMVDIDAPGSIRDQEMSDPVSPEILDVYLENIVKSLRHHVDEIECIFKEFKELRILQGLVEKFVMKGDKK